jgi:hypothetical protein
MARKNLEGLPDKTKEAPAEATAETSGLEILQDDDSTEGADSQEKSLINEEKKGSSGAGRTRVYAILVYEDSAPDDWRERLTQEHVAALISPYHDKDVNPDGSQKKPHWHVMIMFDGPKSQEQVNGLWDRVLGENRVKHYETVNSTRGYGRYLCHMDNPEKAQYSKDDVQALGGADYEEIISLPSDDWEILDQIFDYIDESGERYYSRLLRYCRRERRDWWKLLVQRHSYVVVSYLKSVATELRDEDEGRAGRPEDLKNMEAVQRVRAMGLLVMQPETGELQEGE